MKKIGITSTIPVEILFAAGKKPVDLNNIFITAEQPQEYIKTAQKKGITPNVCGWVKGIYPLADTVDEVIIVESGDCTELLALSDIWKSEGIPIYLFRYPYTRNYDDMRKSIEDLMNHYGTTLQRINKTKLALDAVRKKLHLIDQLTWKDNLVSGFENHLYLVQSSDFKGDFTAYEKEVNTFIEEAYTRTPQNKKAIRLAFIGVPPILTDFYQIIESLGARIVYNEVQHQFSMPSFFSDITEQYLDYTYPYETSFRLQTIQRELQKRAIDGVILYVESFCYKHIQNTLFKRSLSLPHIEIEGTEPGPMDMRTKMRLESFIQMLQMEKGKL